MFLTSFVLSGFAFANEPPKATLTPAKEQPLAIPIPQMKPQTSSVEQKAHADAMRNYRAGHLSIQEVAAYSIAPAGGFGLGYGSGWGGAGWWNIGISSGSAVVRRTEMVFEGDSPIAIPTALDLVGQSDAADRLQRKIRNQNLLGYSLVGVGLGGVGAAIYGSLKSSGSRTLEEEAEWELVSTAGVVGALVGFGVSSFPLNRARRLGSDPWALGPERYDELDDSMLEYNDRLRSELGLSPREAVELESRPR